VKTARATFSFPHAPEEKVAKRNRLYSSRPYHVIPAFNFILEPKGNDHFYQNLQGRMSKSFFEKK